MAVFLYCLIIAGSLWLVIRLSGTYNSGVHLRLHYVNVPKNSVLMQPLDTVVTIKLKAQGFKILSLELFSTPKPLYIDLSKLKPQKTSGVYHYRLDLNNLAALVMEMNDIQTEFTGFEPDSIHFTAEPLIFKKVPVVPVTNLQVEKGFETDSPVTIQPDSVVISGTANQLRDIFAVKTMDVSLKKLNKTREEKVEIQKPFNGKVNVNPEKVNLTITIKQSPD